MFDTSKIELSPEALKNNLGFIQRKIPRGVKICSVIKGNAYGHGFSEYTEMAMRLGIGYFAVHAAEEAYRLLKRIDQKPEIFIMGDVENEAISWAIENGLEFSVFDFARLEHAVYHAKKLKSKAKIHFEIETGMRRTGFENTELPQLVDFLKKHSDNIIFQGLFTHFAGAESLANNFRINKQKSNFDQSVEFFKSFHLNPIYTHAACSAVVLNYPEAIGNMVRVGIVQYGFWPNKETHIRYCGEKEKNSDPLKRVMRWTTRVMALKEVRKGSFVGYGTSYLAHKNMKLAILPVGYSHGYGRNLSNVGSVLINGKHCPIVGLVNMNSITVDITYAGEIGIGDEVVLIGRQKGKEITVNSFSEQANQLNYELLTRLPYGIPRKTASQ